MLYYRMSHRNGMNREAEKAFGEVSSTADVETKASQI
jgi:hypothetical protein